MAAWTPGGGMSKDILPNRIRTLKDKMFAGECIGGAVFEHWIYAMTTVAVHIPVFQTNVMLIKVLAIRTRKTMHGRWPPSCSLLYSRKTTMDV